MRNLKQKAYQIAKDLSPKIGLDLPYFIKGGFWLSIGQFFTLLKAFILSLLFANILSKEVYGQYTFVMSVLGIVMAFSLFGMTNAIVHAIASKKEGTYFKAIKLMFKWSWLGSACLLGVAIYGRLVGREYGALIFVILAAIFPMYAISAQYVSFFNGKKMFDMQVKLTSIFSIISTIFITLAVFVSGTVFWVILTTVLVQIIIQGYYSMMLVRKYIDNKKISKKDIAFGKRTSISLAINNIAMRIDSLIMAFFLGFEKLAIYTIITILPNQLKTLSNSFTPLILPKMTMHKNLKRRDIISYYWKLLLYTIGVIIIYSLLSPIVFKLFYPKYYSFVWLSIIFNISFISFANTIFNVDFIRLNKDKIINKINVISSGYLIVGSFIFIYFFGLIGAIINRMVFRGITMLLNLYYNKKCYAK